MAAPAYRAKKISGAAEATTRTLGIPTGSLAGDTLFVAIKVGVKGTIVAPEGWTEVAKQKIASIENWTVAVFMLPNWNGVTTEFTFTWGGTKKFSVATIWSVEGADPTTPLNAVSSETIQENTPASTKAPTPAYTTTVKECRLFTVVFNNEGFTYTPGTGYTEFGDQADGPETNYKTASVEAGEQAKTESTSGSAVTLTIGFAVQPPQPPKISVSAAGSSTTSLGLVVPAALSPAAAAGSATTNLGLRAPVTLSLASAGGSSSTALGLSARAILSPALAAGVAATSMTLIAPAILSLSPAGGSSTTALTVTAPAILALSPAAGSAGTSMALTGPVALALSPAAGSAESSLALRAPPHLAPAPSSGTSSTALTLLTKPVIIPSPAGGVAATALTLEAPLVPSEGVITAAELKAAKPLDPLIREPPAPLVGEDWHGTFADPGEGTPTGWTHITGEEFSTARWWRYGFPAPGYLGLTFGDLLSESQEIRMVLGDNKVGNSVVLKIVWNNPEFYFYALYEQIGGFEVEPALATGFIPRVKGDRFYLTFEAGIGGIRAWRETGGGDPEVFAEGTLTEPLEAYGHAADLYLQHPGTFRGLDFTAGSLNPEPPIEEKPTPKMQVVLNGGGWGGKEPADIAAAVHMVRFDTERGVGHLEEMLDVGLLIHCLFAGPYDEENGVLGIDPDEWVANALAFYAANLNPTVAPIVEILNEPHGSWFWGPEANTVKQALAYRTLVKKAYEGFHGVYGDDSPKIIASVEPVDSWGERWWEPNVATYLDGVVIHPYGGHDPEEKTSSAEGRRREVKEARVLTANSLPVYCSEFGWPTAIGKEPTGDSLQWTEPEQAANITSFFNWARATGYVAESVYFCHHDFGVNTLYGVVDIEGNHKLGYAAIQEQTAIYDASFFDPGLYLRWKDEWVKV